MRSWAAIRGKFCAPCIQKGASDGKIASSWQHIAAVYPKWAGFGKICAPCIRKALQIAFRECTARRSCHEGGLFAAQTPRITHDARILPSGAAPNRPSARVPQHRSAARGQRHRSIPLHHPAVTSTTMWPQPGSMRTLTPRAPPRPHRPPPTPAAPAPQALATP